MFILELTYEDFANLSHVILEFVELADPTKPLL